LLAASASIVAMQQVCAAELSPGKFELSSLQAVHDGDGTDGMVMNGSDAYFSYYGQFIDDVAGFSSAMAGDINGDGIGDMVIGAYRAEQPDASLYGAVYVVFGTRDGLPAKLELDSLYPRNGGDGKRGFVLAGEASVWGFGRTVSAGDVNGDGLSDIVVGALEEWGRAYVVFGSTEPFPGLFKAASLLPENGGDGSRGVVFEGGDDGLQTAYGVAAVGDLNGDGIEDLELGAANANSGDGQVQVVFGQPDFPALFQLGRLLPQNGGDGSEGFIVNGRPISGRLGRRSALAEGDVNDDGLQDLVLGAHSADEAYVVFGTTEPEPVLNLDSLLPENGGDGSRGSVFRGIDPLDDTGIGTSAGDVNGDGVDDIVPGASSAAVFAGETYVVFGGRTEFAALFELKNLLPANGGTGEDGFIVYASAKATMPARLSMPTRM
jgi:hypothetical protein